MNDTALRLRLWPAIIIVSLMWALLTIPGYAMPGSPLVFMITLWTPIVASALIAIWWLFGSRLSWTDGFLGLGACLLMGAGSLLACHESIGMMALIIFALPRVLTVWVGWLLLTGFMEWPARRAGLLVVLALMWSYFPLLRLEGIDGSLGATISYRWQQTPEEKYLAELAANQGKTNTEKPAYVVAQPGDWPGFRGVARDGRRPGERILTDWTTPPKQVWRKRIGPGWSSFAVVFNQLYTQEQRGENEVVVCYDAKTGTEVWAHTDKARFSEIVAGPGPRATPTFHDNKIYALGAAGKLNCLEAGTGKPIWSRDIVEDSGATVPQWGFSASPLVSQGIVTVFAGGPDKSILGYNAETGELAWTAGNWKNSYCSMQPAKLAGVEQLLIATGDGLSSVEPAKGTVLWHHEWKPREGLNRVIQPTILDETDVLIGTGFEGGTRRLRVGQDEAKEVWTTTAIKPYYNDLITHNGYLYGFDGPIFTCVSLEDGKSKWRARGYGNGQVLLLPDQNLLLILAEYGEVALVEANPDAHKQLGKFKGIEGKTWNHPVVAYGKLYIRNGEEMACYDIDNPSKGKK
jgi:outer membrane protein assembly factor BamB